jgi:hypothetical protein
MPGMLICRTLPGSSLPARALVLIHEYSKPLTRPDWRKSKPIINIYELYLQVKYDVYNSQNNTPLKKIIAINIYKTHWFDVYNSIRCYGVDKCVRDYLLKYGTPLDIKSLNLMPGIKDAERSSNYE